MMPEGKKKYLCLGKNLDMLDPQHLIPALHAAGNKSADTDCVNEQADHRSCCHIM